MTNNAGLDVLIVLILAAFLLGLMLNTVRQRYRKGVVDWYEHAKRRGKVRNELDVYQILEEAGVLDSQRDGYGAREPGRPLPRLYEMDDPRNPGWKYTWLGCTLCDGRGWVIGPPGAMDLKVSGMILHVAFQNGHTLVPLGCRPFECPACSGSGKHMPGVDQQPAATAVASEGKHEGDRPAEA